jgi:hypothetical protein
MVSGLPELQAAGQSVSPRGARTTVAGYHGFTGDFEDDSSSLRTGGRVTCTPCQEYDSKNGLRTVTACDSQAPVLQGCYGMSTVFTAVRSLTYGMLAASVLFPTASIFSKGKAHPSTHGADVPKSGFGTPPAYRSPRAVLVNNNASCTE